MSKKSIRHRRSGTQETILKSNTASSESDVVYKPTTYNTSHISEFKPNELIIVDHRAEVLLYGDCATSIEQLQSIAQEIANNKNERIFIVDSNLKLEHVIEPDMFCVIEISSYEWNYLKGKVCSKHLILNMAYRVKNKMFDDNRYHRDPSWKGYAIIRSSCAIGEIAKGCSVTCH